MTKYEKYPLNCKIILLKLIQIDFHDSLFYTCHFRLVIIFTLHQNYSLLFICEPMLPLLHNIQHSRTVCAHTLIRKLPVTRVSVDNGVYYKPQMLLRQYTVHSIQNLSFFFFLLQEHNFGTIDLEFTAQYQSQMVYQPNKEIPYH